MTGTLNYYHTGKKYAFPAEWARKLEYTKITGAKIAGTIANAPLSKTFLQKNNFLHKLYHSAKTSIAERKQASNR
uniref:Uncharacterized protein n=1 Tax=Romanomermis culicivorax TaxID=13658 RepID=A0A915JEL2_ROMCU